jgi:hypothetical protein
MSTHKRSTSYRFDDETRTLIAAMADLLGMSHTAVLEMLVKHMSIAVLPSADIHHLLGEIAPLKRHRPNGKTP